MGDLSEVIISRVPIKIPLDLITYLRKIRSLDNDLFRVCDDIWLTDRPVAMHTDGTADGLITFGAVVLNDAGHGLVYDDTFYPPSLGTLYRIDGRKLHGTVRHQYLGDDYNFAFLAWDMPKSYTPFEFRMELGQELIGKADQIHLDNEALRQRGLGNDIEG